MSIFNIIIRYLRKNKFNTSNQHQFHETFIQASHDLKNNFLAIRAGAGNIKKHVNSIEDKPKAFEIQKMLEGIEKKVNHSITILNMMTKVVTPTHIWANDLASHSMADCIQQTIKSYPYKSEKHSSLINIIQPVNDFNFTGNLDLVKCVFYFLVHKAIRAMYNTQESTATFKVEKSSVYFTITNYTKAISSNKNDIHALSHPNNPSNRLTFINQVLLHLHGSMVLREDSNGTLIVILHFPE